MSTERTTQVPIGINRASLGNANHVFAVFRGGPESSFVGYVPREYVTVDEQKLEGSSLTAKLRVEVLKKEKGKLFVKALCGPEMATEIWIDEKTGEVITKRYERREYPL